MPDLGAHSAFLATYLAPATAATTTHRRPPGRV